MTDPRRYYNIFITNPNSSCFVLFENYYTIPIRTKALRYAFVTSKEDVLRMVTIDEAISKISAVTGQTTGYVSMIVLEPAIPKGLKIEEIENIRHAAPSGSRLNAMAWKMRDQYYSRKFRLANTIKKIKAFYESIDCYNRLSAPAFAKWDKLCNDKLDGKGITVEEIEEVLGMSPNGSQSQAKALAMLDKHFIKELEGKNTVKELRGFYKTTPIGGQSRPATFDKWDMRCSKDLRNANTIEEIKAVYQTTPGGGKSEAAALKKWFNAANTIEELQEYHATIPHESSMETETILKMFKILKNS